MGLSPASSRATAFTGGTITDGLTVNGSGIDIEAVAGEGLHIRVGTGDSIKIVSGSGATTYFSVDRFGFVSAPEGLSVGADDYLYIQNASVPPDGNLAASTFTLWLDATPGVGNTKLMIKAKDSGGTVRTGAVVLA